ncbi:MAG: hypothetical protein QM770_10090 [Tepidisphaeraceae bacterium]
MSRITKITILGMAASIALMLQPFWLGGFRIGFFSLIASTLAQIIASHLPQRTTDH